MRHEKVFFHPFLHFISARGRAARRPEKKRLLNHLVHRAPRHLLVSLKPEPHCQTVMHGPCEPCWVQ
jgi:hypothetical protein